MTRPCIHCGGRVEGRDGVRLGGGWSIHVRPCAVELLGWLLRSRRFVRELVRRG